VRSWVLLSIVMAVILLGTVATPARANECDKLTYLTFSAPVALPGVTLPAGTYRFGRADCSSTGGILRVTNWDGSQVYGTFLTTPEERTTTSDQPEVVFAESSAGMPEAIRAWFYPGDTVGDELMYPRDEARTIADATDRTVFASTGGQ
jgi:hypothetical protein